MTSRGVRPAAARRCPRTRTAIADQVMSFPSEYAGVSCGWVGRPVLLLCISLPLLPGLVKKHWTATGWLIDTNFFNTAVFL